MIEKKQAIWITGASSGIGRAISILFAKNGLNVIATSRNLESLNGLKKSLYGADNFFVHQVDVKNPNSIKEFYNTISSEFEIDCLINNAGVTTFTKASDDSVDIIQNIISTNLLGSIYTIKEVLPEMSMRKTGTIINIISVVTKKVFLFSSAYSASKAGLLAYTNVLREELRDRNIRIINVSPGATSTNIWPERTKEKYSQNMMSAESIAEILFRIYSEKSNMVVEDIVLRPITGDL